MTLRKRLRVLWAALSQRWHQHTCQTCQDAWYCQGAVCAAFTVDHECAGCLTKHFNEWERAYTARLKGVR